MKDTTNIDKQSLQLFDALIETKNLSKAATKIGIPLPTASRKIKHLEDLFGRRFFVRWMGGMTPSRDALDMHGPIKQVISALDQLIDTKPFSPTDCEQTFRIACVDNAAYSVLGKVLPIIFEQAPHLTIETPPIEENIFIQLKAGNIDMAIFPFRELPPGFHSQRIYCSEQSLVVGTHHPLVAEYETTGEVRIESLKQFRRIEITVNPSQHWQRWRHEEAATDQSIALRTPYFLFAALILSQTNLTLRLPATTGKKLEALGLLRVLPFPTQTQTNSPLLIWHDRMHHSPVIQWIRSIILTHTSG